MDRVYELPVAAYDRAAPLFQAAWFDRAYIDAVFERRQTARLFVDDLEAPRAALLCRTYEYFVAGDPGDGALRRFIADAPAEAGVFMEMYGYVPVGEAWERALLADHGGRLERIGRREFKYHGETAPLVSRARLPEGIAVVPIDRALAERIDRELHQLIGGFWGGYAAFLSDGFGFCALLGEEIAGTAYTAGAGAHYANIDIITAEPYRRRGVGALVASAFIEHCLAHGLIATWDCDLENTASAALALHLGLREYPPFCELGTPGRRPLDLSTGLWSPTPSAAGATVWRHAAAAPP